MGAGVGERVCGGPAPHFLRNVLDIYKNLFIVKEMKILAEFPLEKTLRMSKLMARSKTVRVCGRRKNISHLRPFALHGRQCVCCGKVGNRIIAWEDNGGGLHIDLFVKDSNDKIVAMMTRDHIIPRSKKGPNCTWNYQAMCGKCNTRKGNRESRDDIRLSAFRNHWKKIHVKTYDNFWKVIPGFIRRNKVLSGWFSDVRDLYLYRLTFVWAKISA